MRVMAYDLDVMPFGVLLAVRIDGVLHEVETGGGLSNFGAFIRQADSDAPAQEIGETKLPPHLATELERIAQELHTIACATMGGVLD